jgi:hypothetical protein
VVLVAVETLVRLRLVAHLTASLQLLTQAVVVVALVILAVRFLMVVTVVQE